VGPSPQNLDGQANPEIAEAPRQSKFYEDTPLFTRTLRMIISLFVTAFWQPLKAYALVEAEERNT
jgi:hypothetical protein